MAPCISSASEVCPSSSASRLSRRAGPVYARPGAGPGRPRPPSILAEARKAIGGEDKLAAIKTLEIKGTSRRGATDVNLEGDMTISVELPGKYLRKESIILGTAGIDIVEGLNGSEAWDEQKFSGGMNFDDDGGGGNRGGGFRGGGVRRISNSSRPPRRRPIRPRRQRRNRRSSLLARREVARVILAMLLTTDLPVKWTRTRRCRRRRPRKCSRSTAPDGNPVRLLIDSKTYMPLMLTWTGIAQDPIAALAARSGSARPRWPRRIAVGGEPAADPSRRRLPRRRAPTRSRSRRRCACFCPNTRS